MASVLPDFPPFDIDTDPTSVGITWKTKIGLDVGIKRFDNLLVALDVSDEHRKKALLYIMMVKNYMIFMTQLVALRMIMVL